MPADDWSLRPPDNASVLFKLIPSLSLYGPRLHHDERAVLHRVGAEVPDELGSHKVQFLKLLALTL